MNNHLKIILIDVYVSFLIAIYGTFRCKTTSFKDPITTCFFEKKEICSFLDGWGVLHFFYFMALGFMFPNNLTTIFLMGVLWELVESYSKDHPFYLVECKYVIETDEGAGWWYGRWQDVVMNTFGMFCGYFLFKSLQKNKKKKYNPKKK